MTVVAFNEWLSDFPLGGLRGFRVSDIVRAHGADYQEKLTRWNEKGWLEQRGGTDVWWISDTGKAVLGRAA